VIHPVVCIFECSVVLPHVVPLWFSLKGCSGRNRQRAGVPRDAVRDTRLLGHVTIILFTDIVDITLFDCLGFEGRINTKERFHPHGII
jgi:hypothetical protein